MYTLYIYSTETNTVVARIHGESNEACEAKADELNYMGNDDFGAAYNANGLIDNDVVADYDA